MPKPVYIYSGLKQAIHQGLGTKNTLKVPEVLEQRSVHYGRPEGRADDAARQSAPCFGQGGEQPR